MLKKLLLNENDLKKHLRETADRNPLVNLPKEYPCLLIGEVYKFIEGDFRRCLDCIYREDVWGLVNQLEERKDG